MKSNLLFFTWLLSFNLFSQIPPTYGGLETQNITQTTVRLKFGVRPNGATTTVKTKISTDPDVITFTESDPLQVFANPFNNNFQDRSVDLNNLSPGTTYYWRVNGSNSFGNNQSNIVSFTTLNLPTVAPEITVNSVSPQISNSAISYSINSNLGSTTSIIRYGTDENNLNLQQTGFNADSFQTNATGIVNLTGLLPSTTYYYQVEATNSIGTTQSVVGSFTTFNSATILPIASYNFNNTLTNINGGNPFTQTPLFSLVSDRNNQPNRAVGLSNTNCVATIPGLPYGNSPVTVSIWVRFNVVAPTQNTIYFYGANSNPNAAFQSSSNLFHYSDNSHSVVLFPTPNVWFHYAFSYDGTNTKIYRNGVLLGTAPRTWNVLNNNDLFSLGQPFSNAPGNNNINAHYDDLQIFNIALTDAQVSSLFNNNAVSVNLPSIVSVNAIPAIATSDIQYAVNANGGATTTLIRYGLSESNLNLTQAGFNANGTEATTNTVVLSNLTPTTTYFYRIEATNSAGTTQSIVRSFTTSQASAPAVVSVSATPNVFSAAVNYTINGNFLVTTVVVKYGTTSLNLNQTINGNGISGGANTNGSVTLNGLEPSTTYFYQVEATNSIGTTQSSVESFVTGSVTLINYTFNSTYTDANNANPFGSANTLFVADRNNIASNALRINSTGTPSTAIIPNLPAGNSSRTISFWYKYSPYPIGFAGIFAYGTNANLQTFGLYNNTGGNQYFQAFGNDFNFGGIFLSNTWIHAVLTYDGTAVRLYINGVLRGSQNYALNTVNSAPGFRLGGNGTVLDVDDLQIYNLALGQQEVTSLFNNNTLSSENFDKASLEVVVYPNPVNDILNIETVLDVKSIEIYNIQGQKVLSASQKQINLSNLQSGVYVVKVEDFNNNITQKKIVKK